MIWRLALPKKKVHKSSKSLQLQSATRDFKRRNDFSIRVHWMNECAVQATNGQNYVEVFCFCLRSRTFVLSSVPQTTLFSFLHYEGSSNTHTHTHTAWHRESRSKIIKIASLMQFPLKPSSLDALSFVNSLWKLPRRKQEKLKLFPSQLQWERKCLSAPRNRQKICLVIFDNDSVSPNQPCMEVHFIIHIHIEIFFFALWKESF